MPLSASALRDISCSPLPEDAGVGGYMSWVNTLDSDAVSWISPWTNLDSLPRASSSRALCAGKEQPFSAGT